ncbi:MAG: translation elongation factor-like protein [Methanophagales archaeon]|nr:translation elongation factor-like protein [Methanophagales archaeon]
MAEKKLIGEITHYFTRIGVAVIELSDDITVGDKIKIEGATTAFDQVVDSMEIENEKVETAARGQSIGLKVKERVRPADGVYKITEAK